VNDDLRAQQVHPLRADELGGERPVLRRAQAFGKTGRDGNLLAAYPLPLEVAGQRGTFLPVPQRDAAAFQLKSESRQRHPTRSRPAGVTSLTGSAARACQPGWAGIQQEHPMTVNGGQLPDRPHLILQRHLVALELKATSAKTSPRELLS
jgi:hypothetical protein